MRNLVKNFCEEHNYIFKDFMYGINDNEPCPIIVTQKPVVTITAEFIAYLEKKDCIDSSTDIAKKIHEAASLGIRVIYFS